MSRRGIYISIMLFVLFQQVLVRAQNFEYPLHTIEAMLMRDSLRILIPRSIRFKTDEAKTAILADQNDFFFRVKIKQADKGGHAYNNQPRYELAAYLLQKMFLDSSDYVVPPTAIRAFSTDQFQNVNPDAEPTFNNTFLVFCTLQYWLSNITSKHVVDKERLRSDSLYAYHWGNLNAFTYIINHNDGNRGNIMISNDPQNPRVFAVDNGISFEAPQSKQGAKWRKLMMNRIPRKTFERLKQITLQDLKNRLAVCAQFRLDERNGKPVKATASLDPYLGVRVEGDILQFGLTKNEIRHVHERIKYLIMRVETREIDLF